MSQLDGNIIYQHNPFILAKTKEGKVQQRNTIFEVKSIINEEENEKKFCNGIEKNCGRLEESNKKR